MMSPVQVTVDPSQFPDAVRRDLLESLRSRRLHHKFHYDSYRQARQWLALHEACSPARQDPDCTATFDRAFAALPAAAIGKAVHYVSLGCGGGQKDARLLKQLHDAGRETLYTPVDVSMALVLEAQKTAGLPPERCRPVVCDLSTARDPRALLDAQTPSGWSRVLGFFGMLPNFEPPVATRLLQSLMRPGDWLVVSANLAPGPDYLAGVEKVLPLYDNALTRAWLSTLLTDLGAIPAGGELRFSIEADPEGSGLLRIVTRYSFLQDSTWHTDEVPVTFKAGEILQVFFSYRHTPERMTRLLEASRLAMRGQWVTLSGEEGVWLAECLSR